MDNVKKTLLVMIASFTFVTVNVSADEELYGYEATPKEIQDQACYSACNGGGQWPTQNDTGSASGSLWDHVRDGGRDALDAVGGGAKAFLEGFLEGAERQQQQ